jgi:hypothetical protein
MQVLQQQPKLKLKLLKGQHPHQPLKQPHQPRAHLGPHLTHLHPNQMQHHLRIRQGRLRLPLQAAHPQHLQRLLRRRIAQPQQRHPRQRLSFWQLQGIAEI